MKLLFLLLPTLALAKHYLVTYNCNDFRDRCAKDIPTHQIWYADVVRDTITPQVCEERFNACNDCASREYQCRWDADDNNMPEHVACTKEAQKCYRKATSPGSTIGYYTCKQAHKSCQIAAQTYKSLCRKQLKRCRKCQSKEKQCRFEMGTKKCDDAAGECFDKAMRNRAVWQESWGCWTIDGICSKDL